MSYILILVLYNGGMASIEFNSKQGCEDALKQVTSYSTMKDTSYVAVCAPNPA